MSFGISETHYKTIEQLAIQPLKQSGARVFIFGSRARGDHHPFSDLDILYKYDSGILPSAGLISQILESLENSNIPIKIDLVDDTELAEEFRPSVEKDLTEV